MAPQSQDFVSDCFRRDCVSQTTQAGPSKVWLALTIVLECANSCGGGVSGCLDVMTAAITANSSVQGSISGTGLFLGLANPVHWPGNELCWCSNCSILHMSGSSSAILTYLPSIIFLAKLVRDRWHPGNCK